MGSASVTLPASRRRSSAAAAPVYHRILVPLDHTALDRLALNHAAAMARLYGAKVYLLHVEEGVTSQIYGPDVLHRRSGGRRAVSGAIAQSLRDQGIDGGDRDLAIRRRRAKKSCATRTKSSPIW